ncbi:hypothetical protein H257_10203 [Aphanomyces astaci]|uniref:Uncharacterized protein n=1 Tax=Aphanomyces astaci TaxID=112090 RepID=W4G6N4_APHAT|nr:hypothetical protein H257_10203 [Aphanomyces astaci]ETV75340.1 hypothetical protein H257_10203 [Aphanomyces astaci]|eukprot:XP_009834974.1 hypothetical protein H257_10203 [Aphanomyces astaci]
MSASRVDLGDLIAVVHDKWATSRGLRKFRRYFFSQWLPYNRAYGGTDDVRFWKWHVYHSPPGSSYTNNPKVRYNCELKDPCAGRIQRSRDQTSRDEYTATASDKPYETCRC